MQAKVVVDALQMNTAYEALMLEQSSMVGSMHWKNINGNKYLYHAFTGGKCKSMGRESLHTRSLKQNFEAKKQEFNRRKKSFHNLLVTHAGFIKTVKLNRVPMPEAHIIRALTREGLDFRVSGPSALFAFEPSFGIILQEVEPTPEYIHVFLSEREMTKHRFENQLQRLVDIISAAAPIKQYKRISEVALSFKTRGKSTIYVELHKRGFPMSEEEFSAILQKTHLKKLKIPTSDWLTRTPKFESVAFDFRGMPVRIPTLHPQCYVIFKHLQLANTSRTQQDKSGYKFITGLLDELLACVTPEGAFEDTSDTQRRDTTYDPLLF